MCTWGRENTLQILILVLDRDKMSTVTVIKLQFILELPSLHLSPVSTRKFPSQRVFFLIYRNVKNVIVLKEIYDDKNILSRSESKTHKFSNSPSAFLEKRRPG